MYIIQFVQDGFGLMVNNNNPRTAVQVGSNATKVDYTTYTGLSNGFSQFLGNDPPMLQYLFAFQVWY